MPCPLEQPGQGPRTSGRALPAATARGATRGRGLGCEVAGFTARHHHACVISRIIYRRDQASVVDVIQQVAHERFVLCEINIDIHDFREGPWSHGARTCRRTCRRCSAWSSGPETRSLVLTRSYRSYLDNAARLFHYTAPNHFGRGPGGCRRRHEVGCAVWDTVVTTFGSTVVQGIDRPASS